MSQVKPYTAMGKKTTEGLQPFCQPRLQSNIIRSCTNSAIGKTWKLHEIFPLLPLFFSLTLLIKISQFCYLCSAASHTELVFLYCLWTTVFLMQKYWLWAGGESGKRKEFFKGNKVIKLALSSSRWHFTFFSSLVQVSLLYLSNYFRSWQTYYTCTGHTDWQIDFCNFLYYGLKLTKVKRILHGSSAQDINKTIGVSKIHNVRALKIVCD